MIKVKKLSFVGLLFVRGQDYEEFVGEDQFSEVIIGGEVYIRPPSEMTDARFVESELAEIGFRTVGILYSKPRVIYQF